MLQELGPTAKTLKTLALELRAIADQPLNQLAQWWEELPKKAGMDALSLASIAGQQGVPWVEKNSEQTESDLSEALRALALGSAKNLRASLPKLTESQAGWALSAALEDPRMSQHAWTLLESCPWAWGSAPRAQREMAAPESWEPMAKRLATLPAKSAAELARLAPAALGLPDAAGRLLTESWARHACQSEKGLEGMALALGPWADELNEEQKQRALWSARDALLQSWAAHEKMLAEKMGQGAAWPYFESLRAACKKPSPQDVLAWLGIAWEASKKESVSERRSLGLEAIDIAWKALSPALNEPWSAEQALRAAQLAGAWVGMRVSAWQGQEGFAAQHVILSAREWMARCWMDLSEASGESLETLGAGHILSIVDGENQKTLALAQQWELEKNARRIDSERAERTRGRL